MTLKILGIGLPKTGTSSLNEALRILRFKTFHAPRHFRAKYFSSRFDFGEWDAICNMFEHAFPAIDALYPGTRFIYTRRDAESWLPSVQRAFRHLDRVQQSAGKIMIDRLLALQCSTYNEPILRHVHRYHAQAVRSYFEARSQDVLHLDICAGEGWEKLCAFLGVDVPDRPFPHLNTQERYSCGEPGHSCCICHHGITEEAAA